MVTRPQKLIYAYTYEEKKIWLFQMNTKDINRNKKLQWNTDANVEVNDDAQLNISYALYLKTITV